MIVLQATIVVVLARPFDADALLADSAPLTLLDVRGEEIATLPAIGADRTRWTSLGDLPAIAVSTVIESEDGNFWDHRGVDPIGIARALWLDARGGRYGGSTLTMQLARMLISPGGKRTVSAKVRESLLALRIERAVDKRTILEQWMNRAYFGNGAYGFAAAAQLYFGKPPHALDDGEATLLAILPRAPGAYDPLKHLDAAKQRRDRVLALLVARGAIDRERADATRSIELVVQRHARVNHAPHFTAWLVDQLPPEVRRAGGRVQTTLDLELQRFLEVRVAEQVARLARKNLDQAGVIVLDGQTTEVRAMVGSVRWDGPNGQLNITTRRRNPGSALKPFVYAAALERGASPSTIAWDVREASDQYFAPNGAEHGPVRYREALASSYNFAAVDVIERAGVTRVMSLLDAAGVAALPKDPDDYGPRLALGAAKVRLLDLAAGYGAFVRNGLVGAPRGIEHVTRVDGSRWSPPRVPDRRVLSSETAWMVMDMLADPEARRPGFGMELPFDLPFPIAAKTGTARGFADTWAVGATQEAIVGAWAGTFDGVPTQGLVAMDAAAPLVRDALLAIARGDRLTLPARPPHVRDVEVCATSGLLPGPACPRIRDVALHGHAADEPCHWHDRDGAITYPARAASWLGRRRWTAASSSER